MIIDKNKLAGKITESGKTIKEVAKTANLCPKTISFILDGRTSKTLVTTCSKICSALKCELSDILLMSDKR